MLAEKPKISIIDGLGEVGRSLLEYVLENDLSDYVMVVGMKLPALSFLSESQLKLFDDARVVFKQKNIYDPKTITTCALRDDGLPFDYVFYLDTHVPPAGIDDEKLIVNPAVALGNECVKAGVKALFKLSNGDIYEHSNSHKSTENSKIKPRNSYASLCEKIETQLKKIPNLNMIILRAPIIYGPTCTGTFMKYLSIAYIHKYKNKKMKLLGSGDDKKNTVHSLDVARAAWASTALKIHGGSRNSPLSGCEVYNVSDDNDTDQRKLCMLCESLFNVSTGFQDSIVSSMASLDLGTTSEFINMEVKTIWAEMCKKAGTYGTPLTPFVNKLFLTTGCNLDSTKLKSTFNFSLVHPRIELENIKNMISVLTTIKVWPSLPTQ